MKYFNESLIQPKRKFVAAFDIDTNYEVANPSQGWGEIWPSGAVGNITDNLCCLPIPKENIIQTPRPTPASQNAFLSYVVNNIQNTLRWGTFSEIKSNSPDAIFVLVVDDSGSMTYELVQAAVESLKSIILAAGLQCVILKLCQNERWLQWSAHVVNNIATIYDPNFKDNMCNCTLHFHDNTGCLEMVEFTNPYDGSIIRQSGSATNPNQYWNIDPMLTSGNCPPLGSRYDPFNNEGFQILDYRIGFPSPVPNGPFQELDDITIIAKLKCKNGTFILDVVSVYGFWEACTGASDTGTSDQAYLYWDNIEIPVNGLGYPDGVVALGDPTRVETCSNGGVELKPYDNINIKFTYIGTFSSPTNPCLQYNLYPTTTTTTLPPNNNLANVQGCVDPNISNAIKWSWDRQGSTGYPDYTNWYYLIEVLNANPPYSVTIRWYDLYIFSGPFGFYQRNATFPSNIRLRIQNTDGRTPPTEYGPWSYSSPVYNTQQYRCS